MPTKKHPAPDYVNWIRRDVWTTQQAAYLLHEIDPEAKLDKDDPVVQSIREMNRCMRESIRAGTLKEIDHSWGRAWRYATDQLPKFVAGPNVINWAKEKGYPIPEELTRPIQNARPASAVEQFPIRPKTSWTDITVTLRNADNAHIRALKQFDNVYHFQKLGFATKRKPSKPIAAWNLLRKLADGEGEYTPTSLEETNRFAKQQGVINKKLCHFFKNDEPPVYLERKTFRVRFSLHAPKR